MMMRHHREEDLLELKPIRMMKKENWSDSEGRGHGCWCQTGRRVFAQLLLIYWDSQHITTISRAHTEWSQKDKMKNK